ncbi:ribonuclease domain-containing protein [Psychromicrobium sp. YIM B11713]|uniref:ribonuclease domain-containing protein n=1 Tax=Psychromicrobium sp. YIM B11713 TaxID=3145233 RepID=UPI00374EEF2B
MTGSKRPLTPAARRKQLAGLIAALIVLVLIIGTVFLINRLSAGNTAGGDTHSSQSAGNTKKPAAKPSVKQSSAQASSKSPSNPSKLPTISASDLPQEAQQTLALIAKGGPYPYERDGVNFGNFEGVLPKQRGGYYQEYTVKTPGESDRGARRIIVGARGEKYYTDDHYESFRFILEGQ